MALESILERIKTVTNIEPRVKGGNSLAPITYSMSQMSLREYRLEIDVTGKELDKVQTLATTINQAIIDFADYPQFSDMSININGGGLVEDKGNLVNITYYRLIMLNSDGYEPPIHPQGTIHITANGSYNITPYANAEVDVPQEFEPEGTYTITANGEYNIATYEKVDVNVPIEHEEYEGPYTITPSSSSTTLPTRGLMSTDNITVNPIPYSEETTPTGTTVIIG